MNNNKIKAIVEFLTKQYQYKIIIDYQNKIQ